MKFAYHTARNLQEASVVLLGVPDEKGSHALRKGSAKAPDAIRKVSLERCVYKRAGKKHLVTVSSGEFSAKLYDAGNVSRKQVATKVKNLLQAKKKFIILGGDHSITANIISAFSKPVSVIYFDAHPDLICSAKHYYGSVVCDMAHSGNMNIAASVEVGIRDCEPEELLNRKKMHLKTITSLMIAEKGLSLAWKEIKKQVRGPVYISIDVDVIDPAEAPGVSTPAPGGLRYEELLALLDRLMSLNVVGVDIMEVTPKYDRQNMTCHLAAKLIAEIAEKI